jgi:alkanesulfonate monooxygenase SsuD/methylene tetrahydromethanopterin reductase-like flavin-dependent oxidoreductase (luciferase family)
MEFGTLVFPHPSGVVSDAQLAEKLGFSHAWIPDSHMIWGDVWVCMALAAQSTQSIKLGTGVTVASSRIPPVTVAAVASINRLAPGRILLGFGTGHTARRVMGFPPVKLDDFREEARVIRELLDDGECVYAKEGRTRRIRFLHRDLNFINLDDPIPFLIAANFPKTLAVAGELADGVITGVVTDPQRMRKVASYAKAGAEAAGRNPSRLKFISMTHVCVLRPGEGLDSPRVKAMTGHWAVPALHSAAIQKRETHSVAANLRPVFAAYLEYLKTKDGFGSESYLNLHAGHCTFVQPQEWRFVTPELIESCTIIGPREMVLERLRELEEAGLDQVFINPPLEGFANCLKDFSREIIERI